MQCLCITKCQLLDENGRPRRRDPGEVLELSECPPHFVPLDEYQKEGIDFANAGMQELLASDFESDEIKDYIKEVYGVTTRKKSKTSLVDELIDLRYRQAPGMASSVPKNR